MAWVLVQNATVSSQSGQNPTIAVTNPIGSGNLYCGAVVYSSAQSLSSVTDDKSNTYNLKSTFTQATDGVSITQFELGNITNGPKTITLNFSAATNSCAVVAEFSGNLASSDPNDGTTGQAQTNVASGANNVTSTSITTTVDGDLILGASSDTGNATANSLGTSPNAFTNINTASDAAAVFSLRLEYFVQTTHAAIAATFGIVTTGDNAVSNVVSFKPVAGAATNPFYPTDLFVSQRIRSSPFDKSVALNPNLFKNPYPFNQYNYPESVRVPKAPFDLSVPLNLELFKNPIPFNQFDWSKPVRVPKSPFDLSVPLNLELFKNPIPILNVQGLTTSWGVADLSVPQQPYNQNLYSIVIQVPFNQTDQLRPWGVANLPVPQQPYNQSLYQVTVTVTLMGQIWT